MSAFSANGASSPTAVNGNVNVAAVLNQLFPSLISPNNDQRKQAEATYEALKKQDPVGVVSEITRVLLSDDTPPQLLDLAAVLLRRQLGFSALGSVPDNVKEEIKKALIMCLNPKRPASLRKKVCACITNFTASITAPVPLTDQEEQYLSEEAEKNGLDEEQIMEMLINAQRQKEQKINTAWPDLLPTLANLASHQDAECRFTGHELLLHLTDSIPGSLLDHTQSFFTMCQSGLNDKQVKVKEAALRSTSAFIVLLQKPEELKIFEQLIPGLMSTLSIVLSNSDDPELAVGAIESMVIIAESKPTFWRGNLESVWKAMVSLVGKDVEMINEDVQMMAMEFILGLAEQAGGMVRKRKDLIGEFATALLQACAVLVEEDFDTWANSKLESQFGDSSDDDELAICGEQSLDRFANSIGGNALFPQIMPKIEMALGSQDWKLRRAGLTALALISEGCQKIMKPMLPNLTQGVLQFTKDQHFRVRYAALHCLGQFAMDFKGDFQNKCCKAVIPTLVNQLNGADVCEKLKHCASKSLLVICDGGVCREELLLPHLQPALEGLFQLVKQGKTKTKEDALTTISSITSVIGEKFEPYFNVFMPLAIDVLKLSATEENVNVRGRAVECIGFIGTSVGKERFAPFVKDVMAEFLRILNSPDDAEGRVGNEYLLQGCVRVCECLGADFVPYLQHILPKIFKALLATEIVIESGDVEEQESNEAYVRLAVQLAGHDDRVVGVNTHALQEKIMATDVLLEMITYLKDAYVPYIKDTCEHLYPTIKTAVNGAVRSSAAATLPSLLRITIEALKKRSQNMQEGQTLFYEMLKILLDVTKGESHEDTRGVLCQSMCEISQIAYESGGDSATSRTGFNPPLIGIQVSDLGTFLTQIIAILNSSVKRRNAAYAKAEQDEDFDEEAIEEINAFTQKEFELCVALIEVIGCMIKSHQANFLPFFESHIAPFVNELVQSRIPSIRQAGVCFVDDVVEFCGPDAAKYIPPTFDIILQCGMDPDHQLRQAAVYGLGIFVEFGGEHFAPFAQKALMGLVQVTEHWVKQEDGGKHWQATNNSISAIAKLILKYPQVATPEKFWPLWMSWLPLNHPDGDTLEAQVVHKMFIDEIMKNNVHLTGPNFANLTKVLHIVGVALLGARHESYEIDDKPLPLLGEKGIASAKQLLKSLSSNLPQDKLMQSFGQLNEDVRNALSK